MGIFDGIVVRNFFPVASSQESISYVAGKIPFAQGICERLVFPVEGGALLRNNFLGFWRDLYRFLQIIRHGNGVLNRLVGPVCEPIAGFRQNFSIF